MTSSGSPPRSSTASQSLHQRKNATSTETSHEKENQSAQPKRSPAALKDVKTVSASSFYATSSASSKAPPSSAGSSHTVFGESSALPPPYHAKEPTPFREPELIVEEPMPPLIPAEGMTSDVSDWPAAPGEWSQTAAMSWDKLYQPTAWDTSPSRSIDIDGRVEEEELNWADKDLRETCKRPGPGVLPPLLTQMLHNPDHTLYSVTANVPDYANASRASSVTLSGTSVSPPATETSLPPSAEEVRTSVPHPNAYYCKEHNGWVLLSWVSSSVLPPIAPSYVPAHPFPNQARRKHTGSCIGQDEQAVGQSNKTHHFHKYERAVDARMLTTPYRRSDWETEVRRKQRRRKMTIHLDDEGREIPQPASPTSPTPADETAEVLEADMLDLYLCCQCSTYCLVSQVIPGVIPLRCLEEFNKDKVDHPPPGKTGELALITGWETILTIISNKLWKNEHRVLPVTRPKFQSKLGWNGAVRRIFESLDCVVQPNPSPGEVTVNPPSVSPSTPEGKRSRAKLLRAWIEVSAWLTLYHKSRPRDPSFVPSPLCVNVESATEMIQTGLGAHVNQISRGLLPDALVGYRPLDKAWRELGLTQSCYSPELLMFAYLAQCRCDPGRTPTYFSALYQIVDTMKERGVSPPEQLEMLIAEERSRHRFTLDDLNQATALLGFGKDNILAVELDEEVDDDFIIHAWKNAQKRAWRETSDKASQLRSDLNDAFKIIAEWKCSSALRQAWELHKGPTMSEESAYRTLEVPKEVDETMLITVFNLRVEDQPLQAEKMREAMTVIAEVRDSQRLRDFISTGRDTADVPPENTHDMPRGLNQLGNTCYLNSLLQYFYTIKELRTMIAGLPQSNSKFLDDSKFTDDDLKRHRVGGRMVTRREVQRSKRFVNQLADLFWNLEYCETAAVTPTKELAKLALITSQDEEEDDQGSAGTDTSNDTDATLVDDGPVRASTMERTAQSTVDENAPSASVLGKRGRTVSHAQSMDVDGETADVDKDGYVMVSKPPSPAGQASQNIASSSKQKTVEHRVEDVEMRDETRKVPADAKPPPLPPRRPKEVNESVMMFGRQHDVSECMDNCMFQIETALLDFQDEDMENAESDKTSIVKRLFFGKKRQRLTPLTATSDKRQRTLSTHEKEDIFSHLHINVSDESFDLYDGLGRYFDDVVELNGVKKRMEVTLVDLPPLLQIQLQRVQFDRETQQAYKSQAYVKFGETLYMDRFMDSGDPDKRARSKEIQLRLNVVRDRIQRLTQGKHAPFAPGLGGVAGFLSKRKVSERHDDGEDLISRLNSEQSLVISELERLRAEAVRLKQEQEAIWENETEAAYELTAVFIHRGSSPSFGHYFLYARNLPGKPDQWFKYNDSSVSIVSKEEVLADTTGSTANPYMLVYSRKDSEVIDTVRRFDPSTLQED